jgi:hypothetical protein
MMTFREGSSDTLEVTSVAPIDPAEDREARDQDHLGRSLELGQARGDLEPVDVRQLHVHDRHVRAVCLRFLDPNRAGFGFGDDGEAGPLEQ